MQNYIVKINNCYRYRRWVLSYVSHLDKRKEVKISLKTKDPKLAMIRAEIYNSQIENFWKALIHSGNTEKVMDKYKIAVQLAQSHGFAYKTADQIAALSLEEIMSRISASMTAKPYGENQQTTEALLGGLEQPKVLLSECLKLYWPLIHDRLTNKTDRQIQKWKNPRKLAFNNFIDVIGDKSCDQVTRLDILSFRNWCNEKIKKGWTANSANKQLTHIKDILKTVSISNEIELPVRTLFEETNFRRVENSKPPFEASFVQNEIFPKLKYLNVRDRYALWQSPILE